jgi:hypothetical protein
MRTTRLTFSLPISLAIGVLLVTTACQSQQAAAPTTETKPAVPPPDYIPTATIKDIMQSVVDPNADVVWLSVTTVQSAKGTVDTAPKTDEEWAKVRHGAIALTEASNLLIVPGRHVARPGEKSETPGVELEPSEMEALINKDIPAFRMRAKALHDAGVEAIKAVDNKDAQKVFEVGEQIEQACENCHKQYWYPNEKIPPVPGETAETGSKAAPAAPAKK